MSYIVYTSSGTVLTTVPTGKINTGTTSIDNVKLFDIRGRLLIVKKKVNATQLAIDTAAIGNQVLLVEITSENQTKVTKKILN